MKLKTFTYNEYIKLIHILRLNAVFQLAEETTQYNILENKENQKAHDRLVKDILKNKDEITKFLNQYITKENKIKEYELVKYTNSFITRKYKAKEADLVYKVKNKEIFFLIEHQSNLDSSMPYRMLNYSIDIMNEWKKGKKIGTIKQYPIIVPIVIYTGDKNWKIPVNFREKQISTSIFENYKIDFKYNLIDINKIEDKELIEKQTTFSYFMMLEKAKNKKELLEKLKNIIQKNRNIKQLEEIKNIIINFLNGAIENVEKDKLLEKINKKVGDENMSTLMERLIEEDKRVWKEGISKGITKGITKGIKEGKSSVAKKMLQKNFEEEIILEVVEITKEELEEIKKDINKV